VKQILVYGDSLTWGIVPGTRRRLPFAGRWPGVLESGLLARGLAVRVIEDCLNGRRTVFDDPFKPGRNGLAGLEQRIEACSPLDLVVVALGTNDFQYVHRTDAWHSAEGVAALVRAIRRAPVEPGMAVPPVLVLAPPPLDQPRGPIAAKFRDGDRRCAGMAAAYAAVAQREGCGFFDAAGVTTASKVDGVHLDADQHAALGAALVPVVAGILEKE
jgi:lysophospholipase L1-like esterase